MTSQPSRHTRRNFWERWRHHFRNSFGTYGHHKSAIFFAWILIQHRLSTGNVLTRRYMQSDHWCLLCTDNPKTAMHLFVECSYAKHIWSLVTTWVQRDNLKPSQWTTRLKMVDWWIDIFHSGDANSKKGQTSLIILTLWHIRKERNRRIFQHLKQVPIGLLHQRRSSDIDAKRGD